MSSFRHRNVSKGSSFSAPRPPKGPFDFSHCFTRGVPETFSNALTMQPKPGEDFFNVPRAKIEHKNYVTMLQTLLPHMVELPADNACPDCCFVEDVLVAVPPFKVRAPEPQGEGEPQGKDGPPQDFPGMAIITRPGAPSRQPEVVPLREALFEVGWPQRLIHEIQAPATLDGLIGGLDLGSILEVKNGSKKEALHVLSYRSAPHAGKARSH
ncbi:hypothetical protein DUNSADRAFT_3835 [Dunaliella salina]|uniref:Encoded protein n=1 Tax=Dunaliella salina TaxID=3046 RepID=A0ABQ7GT83_DUNSA|nr:hypothetical protein DUNSADRAFT_3835 [Dunaliella salina]|eukprot:KAF5837819.1 hypothetical protein DUNSADRAFT_3835 [Dunaliella salina]